jgi:hypothetical protein
MEGFAFVMSCGCLHQIADSAYFEGAGWLHVFEFEENSAWGLLKEVG